MHYLRKFNAILIAADTEHLKGKLRGGISLKMSKFVLYNVCPH